jgi:hypothetical protein
MATCFGKALLARIILTCTTCTRCCCPAQPPPFQFVRSASDGLYVDMQVGAAVRGAHRAVGWHPAVLLPRRALHSADALVPCRV